MKEYNINNLISKEYLIQNQILHKSPQGYGEKSFKWKHLILYLIVQYRIRTILDYGCGKTSLYQSLYEDLFTIDKNPIKWENYDPCIKNYALLPEKKSDMVVCTDVLEHIEPKKLKTVLSHIYSLTAQIFFVVISHKESDKFLNDGRNAHLIIKKKDWWNSCIEKSGFFLENFHIKEAQKQSILLYKKK